MSFLITDSNVRYINADTVSISENLPAGVYKTQFSEFIGMYLEKTKISTTHGKIYGESEKIADHIVRRYEKNMDEKNIGVLFSGGKGLGKSLTAKLIIEKLSGKRPIIIVNDYVKMLPDFLSNISNSVIFFDEFEKTMGGIINPSDRSNDAETKQESLLSILDGSSNAKNNLFILTVNNMRLVNDNMISRPGRIKYHYKFQTSSEETIRNYCNDNLERKELEDEIVETLLATRFVSMDIITALVEELNLFPDISVQDAMKYLNIDSGSAALTFRVKVIFREKEYTITNERRNVSLSDPKYPVELGCNTDIKYDEYDNLYLSFSTMINMTKFRVPLIGWLDITEFARIVENGYGAEIKLLKLEVKDMGGVAV